MTKFKFKFDNFLTLNVFNRFEICLVLYAAFVEYEFVWKSLFCDWFHMYINKSTAARERRQTYLSKIQPTTTKLQLENVQH